MTRTNSHKAPSVFISYCHENADEATIDLFVDQLAERSEGSIEIFGDRDRLRVGDSIGGFERKIQTVDAVILLLTPEYRTKVENRSGGVYREYRQVLDRYEATQLGKRSGIEGDDLVIIPIVLAGTPDRSIPNEIRDLLYRDFSEFRAIAQNRTAKPTISDSVRRKYRHLFDEIVDVLSVREARNDPSFEAERKELLALLLLEEKHEAIVSKALPERFGNILERIFVKTQSYSSVSDQKSVILVGRKGSGKSTITEHIHRASGTIYKTKISVDVNLFNFEMLADLVVTPRFASEIRTIVNEDRFFKLVWYCYIHLLGMRTLISDTALGNNLVNINEEVARMRYFFESVVDANDPATSASSSSPWTDFVFVATTLVKSFERYISGSKNDSVSFMTGLAQLANKDVAMTSVFGSDIVSALSRAMTKCKRKLLFVLDGFDTDFDSFRATTISGGFTEEQKRYRTDLEKSWMRGLLHAVLDLRNEDSYLNNKIDFCLTVPKDRFLEVRRSERDDYRYRNIASDIRWTALELCILVFKRLEVLHNIEPRKSLSPHTRLNAYLEQYYPDIPRYLVYETKGQRVSLSLFVYLLRHSFWRPRDIIFLYSEVISVANVLSKRKKSIGVEVVRQTVASATYQIVQSEFLNEFQSVCTNIRDIVSIFERCDNVLPYGYVAELVSKIDFRFADPEYSEVKDSDGRIAFLFEIGFLGFSNPDEEKRKSDFEFFFADGGQVFDSMSRDERRKLLLAIHPVFNEFLRLNVLPNHAICEYGEEYLEANDMLPRH